MPRASADDGYAWVGGARQLVKVDSDLFLRLVDIEATFLNEKDPVHLVDVAKQDVKRWKKAVADFVDR